MAKGRNAQIVIQNMELLKYKESLHAKENKKKDDRTVLFPGGHGRHLTEPEFTEQLSEQSERKEAEAVEKNKRKDERATQKKVKADAEEEWKVIQAEHQKAMDDWKAECERLQSENVRVKDLPPRPKCPLKPKRMPEGVVAVAEAKEYAEAASEDNASDTD
ncbi:hypothetical protein SCP_0804280 [Sparassis crispa]|uniref:Uncharacterized protein n=1 Tax=Sparassis crispa TaxID=139825 RepID=A0A401GVW6_9APHY|nr:hypothetical protein SCP_0804280 [Sparassis crispa]GBE85904.1 hypothetical protein SCP_0804280 [Sparassis crispa]